MVYSILTATINSADQENTTMQSESPAPATEAMNVNAACQYLGCAKQWLYAQVKIGALPHYRVGPRLRFRKSSLDAWITTQEQQAQS